MTDFYRVIIYGPNTMTTDRFGLLRREPLEWLEAEIGPGTQLYYTMTRLVNYHYFKWGYWFIRNDSDIFSTSGIEFFFRKREDAILFKLSWGGK